MKSHTLMASALSIGIVGCAATPLQSPEASNVVLTHNTPAGDCKFLGEVQGSESNIFIADFENLVISARNKMRDAAYQLGANFVQLELEDQSDQAYDSGSMIIGNAYSCPSNA